MKTIIVSTPFTLNLGGGEFAKFGVGQHDVKDEIAAHWYVQAHSELAKAEKSKDGDKGKDKDKDTDKGSK